MVTAVYKRKAAYAPEVYLFEQAFIARQVPKVFHEDTNTAWVVHFLFSNANLMRSAIGFGRREMGMVV